MSARTSNFCLALAAATVLGCTGLRAASDSRPIPERQSALALAEPDPATKDTVQAPRQPNPLEQVSAAVAIDRKGQIVAVHLLQQGLTPAQQLEVRRAFETVPWRPGVGPNGEPADDSATTILLRAREP